MNISVLYGTLVNTATVLVGSTAVLLPLIITPLYEWAAAWLATLV